MAKIIKYKFVVNEINHGTEENPDIEQILLDKTLGWSEASEETAKHEAYNGKYVIDDDGLPELDTASTDDVLNALLGVTV